MLQQLLKAGDRRAPDDLLEQLDDFDRDRPRAYELPVRPRLGISCILKREDGATNRRRRERESAAMRACVDGREMGDGTVCGCKLSAWGQPSRIRKRLTILGWAVPGCTEVAEASWRARAGRGGCEQESRSALA